MNETEVLKFWFEEIDSSLWFQKNDDFDQLLIDRFTEIHRAASQGELYQWRKSAEGRLAEVIILDQFSRNMFRETPQAFAQDTMALALSQEAIRVGDDLKLPVVQRSFLYMPFMHSESKKIHEVAVELFNTPGMEHNHKFELMHKKIIDRFGRYPHRNKALGRVSSQEELDFLKEANSSF